MSNYEPTASTSETGAEEERLAISAVQERTFNNYFNREVSNHLTDEDSMAAIHSSST